MIDAQAHEETAPTQYQGFQTYHSLRTPLSLDVHSRGTGPMSPSTRERVGTLTGDAQSSMDLEVVQEDKPRALEDRDLFVELEVEGVHSGGRVIFDQESSGDPNQKPGSYHDPRTSSIDLGYKRAYGQTEVLSEHSTSDYPQVFVKREQTTPSLASIDIVQRGQASGTTPRSIIRVSSPVAEQFYRSARVKVEEDEVPRSTDDNPQRSNQQPSIPTNSFSKISTSGVARKPIPTQQPIKEEVGGRTSQTSYYIPTGAEGANSPPTPHAIHASSTPSSRQNLHHTYMSHQYEAKHVFPATYTSQNRHTATASPTPSRPDTKLSYLRAVTPTPFSTPYGMVNHHPYAAHLHFIPGPLLEGMLRRTKWGDAATRGPSRREVEREQEKKQEQEGGGGTEGRRGLEGEASDEMTKEENTRAGSGPEAGKAETTFNRDPRRKTCVWYRLPFCTCCKWSVIAVPVSRESVAAVSREPSRRLAHDSAAAPPTPAPRPAQLNRFGENKAKWWRRLRGAKKARVEEAKRRLTKKKGDKRRVMARDTLPVIRVEEVRHV